MLARAIVIGSSLLLFTACGGGSQEKKEPTSKRSKTEVVVETDSDAPAGAAGTEPEPACDKNCLGTLARLADELCDCTEAACVTSKQLEVERYARGIGDRATKEELEKLRRALAPHHEKLTMCVDDFYAGRARVVASELAPLAEGACSCADAACAELAYRSWEDRVRKAGEGMASRFSEQLWDALEPTRERIEQCVLRLRRRTAKPTE